MRVHSLNLSFVLVCVLFVVSFSNADHQQFEIVGLAECADCQQNNFKTSHAFSGLHVTIDCKSKKGMKRVGDGEVDEGGKFEILLPKGIRFPKTKCYAQLHSAAAVPCPAQGGVETAKIEFKSQIHKKIIFSTVKNLRFSTALCTSKLLWPVFDYPPLPKTDPWKNDWPKITIPPLGSFSNPWWSLPPTYKLKPKFKPMFKPPIVPTYKPMPKPPAFKPFPPAVPIYKPPTKPITKPPVVKPLPPPVPIYNKPPVPIYNKPPVVKSLPPPVPIYNKPPVVKLPPQVPIYKPPVVKPLPPPVPIYKQPVVKSLPPPVSIYKPKPLPPAVPIYKLPVVKPLPPAVPVYEPPVLTKPLPPPFPLFPLPPLYKKKPCPPFTKIPPKYFEHPKFGYFPKLPPFNP